MPSVLPAGPRDLEPGVPRQGRERGADTALRLAIEQGGETAATAVQLAMLETLERLANSGERKVREPRGDTLEELLFGGEESQASGSEGSTRLGGGVRGVMGMQRICASIDAEPERWSMLFDQSVYRSLGSDLTGAPWSVHRYGQEKINFGRHGDLKKMWFLLASLHALHRAGKFPLLGAKIAQFLKSIEVAVTMGGQWSVAWPLTGVADPDPSTTVHGGLTTPLEVATAIAYVKDARILEEASRKAASSSTQPAGHGEGNQAYGRGQGGGRRGRGGGKGAENQAPPSGRHIISEVLRMSSPPLALIEEAIGEYFNKRVVPINHKRENLKETGKAGTYSRSLLLGLFTVRGTGISKGARSHADLLRLCHLLASHRPQQMQFPYRAIMVNENRSVPFHQDLNNFGPSCLRSLGEYSGGDFHQVDDTTVCGRVPDATTSRSGHQLSTRHCWI
eukprot:5858825-Amphidinium_carterae.1